VTWKRSGVRRIGVAGNDAAQSAWHATSNKPIDRPVTAIVSPGKVLMVLTRTDSVEEAVGCCSIREDRHPGTVPKSRGPIETVVFHNGASSAVRLLRTCKLLQGQKVRMWREGQRILIEPLIDVWPTATREVAGIWKGEIPRPP